jgi:hypothetical protein|eukprot:COSAG06_NODE_8575_length_2125_cov_20.123889_3_plen_34_part_00
MRTVAAQYTMCDRYGDALGDALQGAILRALAFG